MRAQYPDTIYMRNKMIGNATVVARRAVIHFPGFRVTAGLFYHAYIDTNFSGNGFPYVPPPVPGNLVITPSDENYIITYSPQIVGFDTASSYTCDKDNVDIIYFDGLGRELQDVSIMASPGQKDIIKPFTYDNADRKNKDYIPYEAIASGSYTGTGGQFDANFSTNQQTFIKNLFGDINKEYGFTEYQYEESPLNRVLKQSAPGSDWALYPNSPSQEHVTEFEYSPNTSQINSWIYENNTFEPITYNSQQLFVTTTENENTGLNRSITNEYKDKTGLLIMSENLINGTSYQTKYIYDDLRLLRCVVPPAATAPNNSPGIQDLCFYYDYDARQRMVYKKLPDAGWVYMVYDKRDRLVLSQDAKMRSEDPAGRQWQLFSYDQLNRKVMSGIYTHSSAIDREGMQSLYDSLTNINETLTGNSNDSYLGYSHNVFSGLCNGSDCNYTPLTATYYDNYNFIPHAPPDYSYQPNEIVKDTDKSTNTTNLVTGEKVIVINPDSIINQSMLGVTYYDYKHRAIQTINDNTVPNGEDITSFQLSFTGRILAKKTRHIGFTDTISYTEKFIYDHRGRLLEHSFEGLPHQPKIMVSSMHYNQLGQLMNKLTYADSINGGYNPFIQKIDYNYNIRGWLTSINNPDSVNSENDIFSLNLLYENTLNGVTYKPQYNGNISSMEWKTNLNNNKYAYGLIYDDVNRLDTANFFQNNGGWTHDKSFDENNISYDANGNILTLDRYATSGQKIDQLTYNYFTNSNQIAFIKDMMGDVPGVINYPGDTSSVQSYFYDDNGNMIQDLDKGLDAPITYNYLNKPEILDFGNGEKIEYIYDGSGEKLVKEVLNGNILQESSLIYSGNFVYNWNDSLQYILTDEGRLVPDGNTYRFEYFMKDHLGNTRATYAAACPGVPQVAEYNHYYPFGMELQALCYTSGADLQNNNLYNSKELQPDYGLQWYDYGARFYDPEVGTWHSIDQMAEKYFSFSPFVYVFNNPIKCIDPNGKDGVVIVDKENKVLTIRANYYVPTTEIKGGYNGPMYKASEVDQLNSSINSTLNTNNYSVTEGEYKGYSVRFDLQFKEGGNQIETYFKLGSDNIDGNPISNTFEKGNSEQYPRFKEKDNGDGTVSIVGGFTSNQNQIIMNSSTDTKRNRIHEIFHTLFFNHDKADKGIGSYKRSDMPNQDDINMLINNPNLPKIEQKKDEKSIPNFDSY